MALLVVAFRIEESESPMGTEDQVQGLADCKQHLRAYMRPVRRIDSMAVRRELEPNHLLVEHLQLQVEQRNRFSL